MKGAILFLVFWVCTTCLPSQEPIRYYRVDQVRTVSGEIVDIKSEKSFKDKDFTILYLKESKSGTVYQVEVSPRWFFKMPLLKGSRIEVVGSYGAIGERHTLMTRSITFRGEIYRFRDQNGFPLWRGERHKTRSNRRRTGRKGQR